MIALCVRIVSIICSLIGISFIVPISVALYCGEYSQVRSFAIPMAATIFFRIVVELFTRKKKSNLSIRACYAIVALDWFFISFIGAIPFYLSGFFSKPIDAFFESVSGFTTTGCSILTEPEALPRCINLWRCMTHWLGGMGIVVLTVALLEVIGVGGFQLIKAETTGPDKGKLTAKVANTSKILWFIYLIMTGLQTVILTFCGMDFIDALSHAFSTMGTGGFSSRNASIGSFNSVSIEIVCTVFMFLAGINFSLYFYLFTGNISEIKSNTELKAYVAVVVLSIAAMTVIQSDFYGGILNSLRYSAFQVNTILSTTGFATSDYTVWHPASQAIILMLFFMGGCSGSTAGGVKIIRWVILGKQFKNEIKKILHPHGVFSIQINQKAGRKDVVFVVSAFLFIYALAIFVTMLIGCIFGMDLMTSFSGAFSMVGNVGPGFNLLGPSCNYGWLHPVVKGWYCIAMISGRLELFTIAIMFSPEFWKK